MHNLTEIQAEIARRDLARFIKEAWQVVEPSTPYQHNWHIDMISEYLLAITMGELRNVIFNIAPRHMKSRQISTFWPVWEWIDDPAMRYLFSSYAVDLARDHSRERRVIIESDYYQERWGDNYSLTTDQNQVTYFANDRGGRMQARGTSGIGTGKGGNRIIIDDPHNTKQAESQKQRETAITDFHQNLITRLDNPKTGAIILVMQRLHAGDLTGDILKNIGGFELVKIPSISQKKTIVMFPRSKKMVERDKGDLLWESRMGQRELDIAKNALGTYGFNAQHLQEPVPEGGNRIKGSWFPRYRVIPANPIRVIQSWDTGNKPKDTSAPTVGMTFIDDGEKWLLVDVFRRQMGYPELKRIVRLLAEKWSPQGVLIEDKASGISLIQDLRADGGISIIPIEPESDKITRMETQSPHIEAGRVALPEDAPWLGDFETEIFRFPEPETWDQIDTLSQFLKYAEGKKRAIIMQELDGI